MYTDVQYTHMYSVHSCTVYTVHLLHIDNIPFPAYNVNVQYIVYNAHFTMYTMHYIMYIVHSIVKGRTVHQISSYIFILESINKN